MRRREKARDGEANGGARSAQRRRTASIIVLASSATVLRKVKPNILNIEGRSKETKAGGSERENNSRCSGKHAPIEGEKAWAVARQAKTRKSMAGGGRCSRLSAF